MEEFGQFTAIAVNAGLGNKGIPRPLYFCLELTFYFFGTISEQPLEASLRIPSLVVKFYFGSKIFSL